MFGEMKSKMDSETSKASLIEIAGKTSVLLYAQDGRHAAPSIRILGSIINVTFFDRGGSLQTEFVDMQSKPDIFLHILVGLAKAMFSQLGFDISLLDDAGNKHVLVAWDGGKELREITIENLIIISDIMHGCASAKHKNALSSA